MCEDPEVERGTGIFPNNFIARGILKEILFLVSAMGSAGALGSDCLAYINCSLNVGHYFIEQHPTVIECQSFSY